MSIFALQPLLLSLLLFGTNAVQIQPTQKMKVGNRANPIPTPRAVIAENKLALFGRKYYNTLCGYVEGNINYPVTCPVGYTCATANHYYAAGCCNPNELSLCDIPSTCIPYGGICNAACQAAVWTSCGYLAPYCFTRIVEYGNPYYAYECATVPGVQTILTTVTGALHTSAVTPPVPATHSIIISATTPSVQTTPSTPASPPHTSTAPLFGTQPIPPSTTISPSPNIVVTSTAATNTVVVSATSPGVQASPSTANSSPPNSILTSSPVVTAQSNTSSTPATPVPESGSTATGNTNISCGSNSSCGNGQGSNGNDNGIGNDKSGASRGTRSPTALILLALVFVGVLISL